MRVRRRSLFASFASALFPVIGARAAVPAGPMRGSGEQDDGVVRVPDRKTLRALAPVAGKIVFMDEAGRAGLFACRAGDAPAGDPLEGLSISASRPGFFWARQWDGVHGRPEWFGAVTDSAADVSATLAALHACVALCPVTQLAAADYWIDGTWVIDASYRSIAGPTNASGFNTGAGARILSTNPGQDVVHIGGKGASNASDIFVSNICARWAQAAQSVAQGREMDAPKAFSVQRVTSCQLRNLSAHECAIGFYFYATVYTKALDCRVFRSTPLGGANDFFRAFWVRGIPAFMAGGNASLYLVRCNVTMADKALPLVHPTALLADGDFADLYVDDFETSQVAFPILLDGAGGSYPGGHGDVHIRNVVLDQIIGDGIDIRNLHPLAKIHINGGYIQVVDSKANNKGLWLRGGNGQITVSNMQILGEDASSTSIGVCVDGQPNVAISDSVIVETIARPVVVNGASPRISIRCMVNGGSVVRSGIWSAIAVTAGDQVEICPKITGQAGHWVDGIEMLGAAHRSVKVDPTMVDRNAIGSGRKISINNNAVVAPGYYNAYGNAAKADAAICVTGFPG